MRQRRGLAFLLAFSLFTAGTGAAASDDLPPVPPIERPPAYAETEAASPDADAVTEPQAVPESAPRRYAVGAASYRVTFDANGGAGQTPGALTAYPGESVRLPGTTGVIGPGGLRFCGWSSDRNAAAPAWVPGDTLTPAGNLTLYAVYLPATAVVTYQTGTASAQETVSPGARAVKVPALPEGYAYWRDEEGQTVDPAQLVIWGARTFTAVPAVGTRIIEESVTEDPATWGAASSTDAQTETNAGTAGQPGTSTGTDTQSGLTAKTSAQLWPLRTDHGSIMSGYEDGLFYPEREMSRAQAAKVLYSLLASPPDAQTLFSGMTGQEWYAAEVGTLHAMGLLRAKADGAFHGDDAITRAEFADMLAGFVPAVTGTAAAYPDVPADHWAWGAIQTVTAAGLFAGDQTGQFRPDGLLTRAQAAVVFNRLLGRAPDGDVIRHSPNVRIFPDVPADYWAYEQIMEACVTHTFQPARDGSETWTSVTAGESPVADGYYTVDGYLFRVAGGRYVRNTTLDGAFYDVSGRYTTGTAELDEFLRDIVQAQTETAMTRDEKLKALHEYLRNHFTYLARNHIKKGQKGWEAEYALAFFQSGRGNCFSFAAGFYELARWLGVDCATVVGQVGSNRQDHGWVEVYTDGKTWLYDSELEMAYRQRGNYSLNLCKFTYASAPFSYYK